ncbi:hypothetical protein NIES4071_09100 [Calothrix sp. NIES-4071]|nr:hypothetical protein NIES4071_09100 [Calothrix sp. NIES-4071]BAZ55252.1 hypothetical protein NIES4105_09060 [Calothrix sp. NIES-4105]
MPNLYSAQDLRLLLPETVFLEADHFALANQTSSKEAPNSLRAWQVYLNTLALLALEVWLDDRLAVKGANNRAIERDMSKIAIAGNLKVGDYKFCAIATEHLLDEIVNIPESIIQPELAPHFYVLLEVLEEEEEVIIRGFLPYNQFIEIQNDLQLPIDDGCYKIPLSYFDIEPNHILAYCRYIQASEFTIPIIDNQVSEIKAKIITRITKLSQWLQGVIDEGWQTIDSFTNPDFSLAFSTRNINQGTKRVKTIDLDSKKFALLVNISPDTSTELSEDTQKMSVLAQLYPPDGEKFVPQNVKLILLSKAGKTLQEVTGRVQDNYIQLKPFKGELGKKFSIQVSFGNANVIENFEL